MVAVAALLVGTSVPANALYDPQESAATAAFAVAGSASGDAAKVADEGQILEAEAVVGDAAAAATRDEWSVTSYAELLRLRYGNRDYSYSTTGIGAVRWPFPYAVPISSGFGERAAPCRGCSSYHQGLDFNPGAGAPIYTVAEGVVVLHDQGGGFGNHVIVEHVINGQKVQSVYAHMIWDSSPLVVGQVVPVGEYVGLVGSSGTSTGAHLHFEIRLDGIAVDPFAWLSANAS